VSDLNKVSDDNDVNMNAIEMKNVTKSYSNIDAVKNVSFKIKVGKLVGIVGANGA